MAKRRQNRETVPGKKGIASQVPSLPPLQIYWKVYFINLLDYFQADEAES